MIDEQTVSIEYVRSLEERIMRLEAERVEIDYGAPNNTNEECRAHTCIYYTHYLAYGPAELQHEDYHAAENAYERHADTCEHDWAHGPCPRCVEHEKRIRA